MKTLIILLLTCSFCYGQREKQPADKKIGDALILSSVGVAGLIFAESLHENPKDQRIIRTGSYVFVLSGLICAAVFHHNKVSVSAKGNELSLTYKF